MFEFLEQNQLWGQISALLQTKLAQCILVLFFAFLINRLIISHIMRVLNKTMVKHNEDMAGRYETLFHVLKKLFFFIVYFFAVLCIIQILFQVSPASLIAATGVVGVAAGLGAQSLVKDSINGFFLLFENQFSVGELVTIDGFCGTVIELTLRTTKLQNINGDQMTLPNSAITKVINHSRAERGIIVGVEISYEDDIDFALKVLQETGLAAQKELDVLTREPEVWGVASLGQSGITLKLLVHCENGSQFGVEREMLRRIYQAFEKENITIPYQHIMVINQEGRAGK